MYRVQIVALTVSNLAMVPGVLFSVHAGLHLVAVGLFTAASASVLYHLCDTDTYCVGDLSFQSLQVSLLQ
jgi:hypothetical protein